MAVHNLPWATERNERVAERLGRYSAVPKTESGIVVEGVLKRSIGLTLEASGCQMPIGGHCRVEVEGGSFIEAEVVGFDGNRSFLMPTGDMTGMKANARVLPDRRSGEVAVGDGLLGRVFDGSGQPLDGLPSPRTDRRVSLMGGLINPLEREPITEPLDVGVRAINGLLTVGRGQRIGLFAGSGVGKSSLLGMMTRHTNAEVVVVAMIGERGREVREFVQETLGPEGMQRAVVIATPADRSPLMRVHAAWRATAIAEHFRSRGKHVLLLMDSLTRFAQAQREIGLAVGEPPTTRGYPPSVFARLPMLVERAGNGAKGAGSITAVYTVLTEGDDPNDPVADTARAILDGHVVLSRNIAETGRYPAIDIEASVSRVARQVTSGDYQTLCNEFRQLYSAYQRQIDLIRIGAYQRGSDPVTDRAVDRWSAIFEYLRQSPDEGTSLPESMQALVQVLGLNTEQTNA